MQACACAADSMNNRPNSIQNQTQSTVYAIVIALYASIYVENSDP